MSDAWDINIIRKIAGISVLTEGKLHESEDDEDLTPAERALADKAEKDLKAKGIKVSKKIDPEKDIARMAARHKQSEVHKEETEDKEDADAKKIADVEAAKEKAAEPKINPKSAEKQERKAKAAEAIAKKEEGKPEEKKEGESTEAKRRGKPVNPSSHMSKVKAWVKEHPAAKRKEVLDYAESIGASRNYVGSRLGAIRKGLAEGYVLRHPGAPTFLLAEDREQSRFIWVDFSSELEPLFLESEAEANRIATYLTEWKGMYANVEKIIVDEQ